MCDSLAIAHSHTAEGQALFAKNSDRLPGECQPFLQFPAAVHPVGASVRCSEIAIPQVSETLRVMGHSPWWVWGFEHGINERGVAIGNHTVFSKEAVEEQPGLIGMDLVRLGLERGRSAREALEVIAGLLETHGQGGAGLAPGASGYHNSFLIAAPEEIWVLETSGRHWAARRTELGSLTNHMTLGSEWEIGSRDFEAFARQENFWDEEGRIDWAAAYRNPHVPAGFSEGRRSRSERMLAEGDGRHGPLALQEVLRDHGEAGIAGVLRSSPEEEQHFTLCMHTEPATTTASMVVALVTDAEIPQPAWISFGTPCTGVFLPVYLDGVLPAALARGGEVFDEASAWWVFQRLQEAAETDLVRNTQLLRDRWRPFEAALQEGRLAAEASARGARMGGDEHPARRIFSEFMETMVAEALAQADALREDLEGRAGSA
ncbi:MAG: C69 family dipeptidase [Myxococcota bacterium]